MDVGAITSINSRTTHVIADGDMSAIVGTAACGATVYPRPYQVKPSNEVCKKCRRALGWPFIVTWESQGHTFTTDFN